MQAKFNSEIKASFPFLMGKRLLLACSGGVDSVVLVHLCVGMGLDVTLAHCNFNLRGAESDGDEAFVRELAASKGLPILVKSFHTKQQARHIKGSIQMVARELRYQWFNELIASQGFEYVLTAHHADDRLETFLINLSRGTGIDGLSGIPAYNNHIVRPLLNFSREDILGYAKSNDLLWREDSSNSELKYLRNKIRKELVPSLKELHPTFLQNFLETQKHLNQTKELVYGHIRKVKETLFEDSVVGFKIKVEKLLELHPLEAYLYQLFSEFGFSEWGDLKELLTAMSGKCVESKEYRLLKDREYLILSPKLDKIEATYQITEADTKITFPIALQMETVSTWEEKLKNVAFLDKEKLNYPLELRNWKKGDYFYPLGMKGKKKLSKFFKDQKIDVFSKEKQWLLCSDGAIVWIVGRRLDDRFKIDGETKNILKITYSV